MIKNYHHSYLEETMDNVGHLFQHAEEKEGISIEKFIEIFRHSKVAWGIENGIPHYMVGMTGSEMLMDILGRYIEEYPLHVEFPYWVGWASVMLQWVTGWSFDRLFSELNVKRLYILYKPYHCMDPTALYKFGLRLRKGKVKWEY